MVSEEMTCPVPLYQDAREMDALLILLRELKPMRILEVGSLYGGTLWNWMNAAPGSTVVSVDAIAVGVPEHPAERIKECRAMWPEFAAQFGCELHTITERSESEAAIVAARALGPYDYIFIDAGHKYAEVDGDFRNYWPMLRAGGLMALHDCACRDKYPNIDVGTWWRSLEASGKFYTSLISYIPGWWGIGVIQK